MTRASVVASALVLASVACGGRAVNDPHSSTELRAFTPPANGEGQGGIDGRTQEGLATWYGESLRGHKTASGERFDPDGYTAAHRTLPLGSEIAVERIDSGARVVVRVNDRGPFGDANRVVDISKHAASDLDMLKAGVVRVRLTVLKLGAPPARKR